ncbi:MAG TPA: hypothetical protein VK797_24600 [Tepidisphaeraceae bacterium]|jgi:hypothetical protein|nr:hypothetical protein [Tepidisphaeraceae bacterium]
MRLKILRLVPLLAILLTGCGPMFLPETVPLSPEEQKQVDSMWDNLLSPVNRVNRQTLFDAILVYWLFQSGVDRLHMTSEKFFAHGKAVMEIDCERANPQADQFSITVLDDRGRTLRRERYSRADIEKSAADLSSAGPTTRPCRETPEQRQHRLEQERRMGAVEAATQPAAVSIGK